MSKPTVSQTLVTSMEQGLQYALGMKAPTLSSFENASAAAYEPGNAGAYDLRLLTDASGEPVSISTASGVTASAFVDAGGNLIVAYQGTATAQQTAFDVAILSGTAPSGVPGFGDALSFYQNAVAIARSQGLSLAQSYVTGFSLGGTLASYVASQTGAAGAAFASSGVPGYEAPAKPAANFVTFVEKGDPFAQYATDGAEKSSAAASAAHMDHYGTVVSLGTAADAAALKPFATAIAGVSIGKAVSGQTALPQGTIQSLTDEFYQLAGTYHTLARYDGDATATGLPAKAVGLQDTSMSAIAVSLKDDMVKLTHDMPKIAASNSLQAGEALFAKDFPDLVRELTQATHAAGFASAVGTVLRTMPSLAADLGNPAKLSADLLGLASGIVGRYAPTMPVTGHPLQPLLATDHASTVLSGVPYQSS